VIIKLNGFLYIINIIQTFFVNLIKNKFQENNKIIMLSYLQL
jgi:hypothetical protein